MAHYHGRLTIYHAVHHSDRRSMHFPLGPDLFPMTAATGRPSSEMWRPDGHHRSRSSSQQQPVVSVLTTSLPAVSQCRQLNHRSTVGVQVYLWAITAEVTIIIKCSKTHAGWLQFVPPPPTANRNINWSIPQEINRNANSAPSTVALWASPTDRADAAVAKRIQILRQLCIGSSFVINFYQLKVWARCARFLISCHGQRFFGLENAGSGRLTIM